MKGPDISKVLAFEISRRYEVCDRCGKMARSVTMFFDGREFLCPECRAKQDLSKGSGQPNKSEPEAVRGR